MCRAGLLAAAETLVIYASCSDRREVGQGNANILQHLSQIAEMALAISFS